MIVIYIALVILWAVMSTKYVKSTKNTLPISPTTRRGVIVTDTIWDIAPAKMLTFAYILMSIFYIPSLKVERWIKMGMFNAISNVVLARLVGISEETILLPLSVLAASAPLLEQAHLDIKSPTTLLVSFFMTETVYITLNHHISPITPRWVTNTIRIRLILSVLHYMWIMHHRLYPTYVTHSKYLTIVNIFDELSIYSVSLILLK